MTRRQKIIEIRHALLTFNDSDEITAALKKVNEVKFENMTDAEVDEMYKSLYK